MSNRRTQGHRGPRTAGGTMPLGEAVGLIDDLRRSLLACGRRLRAAHGPGVEAAIAGAVAAATAAAKTRLRAAAKVPR